MDHIGIDLGGRESQVCVRNGEGVILEEARRATRALGPWLATRSPARVIVETCTEASRLIRRVSRPDVLMTAALLHDIGKGERVDHSVAGEPLAGAAASLATRLEAGRAALSEREREVFTTFVLGGVAEELRRRINQACKREW